MLIGSSIRKNNAAWLRTRDEADSTCLSLYICVCEERRLWPLIHIRTSISSILYPFPDKWLTLQKGGLPSHHPPLFRNLFSVHSTHKFVNHIINRQPPSAFHSIKNTNQHHIQSLLSHDAGIHRYLALPKSQHLSQNLKKIENLMNQFTTLCAA